MEDGVKFDEVELNFILEAIDAYKEIASQRRTDEASARMIDHYLLAMKEIEERIADYLG